jgi:hypothetical protein
MDTISQLVAEALDDFRKVAVLANAEFIADTIAVEIAPKPHQPPASGQNGGLCVLPEWAGTQGGQGWPNSNARYTSQHYLPKTRSSR